MGEREGGVGIGEGEGIRGVRGLEIGEGEGVRVLGRRGREEDREGVGESMPETIGAGSAQSSDGEESMPETIGAGSAQSSERWVAGGLWRRLGHRLLASCCIGMKSWLFESWVQSLLDSPML